MNYNLYRDHHLPPLSKHTLTHSLAHTHTLNSSTSFTVASGYDRNNNSHHTIKVSLTIIYILFESRKILEPQNRIEFGNTTCIIVVIVLMISLKSNKKKKKKEKN